MDQRIGTSKGAAIADPEFEIRRGRWYWAAENEMPHFYGEDLVAVCGHDVVTGPLPRDLAGADGFFGDSDCPTCVAIVRRATQEATPGR